MRQPGRAGGTGSWQTCPPTRAYYRRAPVPIWLLCLTVRFRRALTLAKRATAARRRQKKETHRYIFTVHALDVDKIEVDEGASGAMVGFNVHFHSLGSASITAMYS